jgi:hypothetical protein
VRPHGRPPSCAIGRLRAGRAECIGGQARGRPPCASCRRRTIHARALSTTRLRQSQARRCDDAPRPVSSIPQFPNPDVNRSRASRIARLPRSGCTQLSPTAGVHCTEPASDSVVFSRSVPPAALAA